MPTTTISPAEFLDRLEQSKFAPIKVIESLRAQLERSVQPVGSQALANLLIEKQYLTPLQAQQLLTTSPRDASRPAPVGVVVETQVDRPTMPTASVARPQLGKSDLANREIAKPALFASSLGASPPSAIAPSARVPAVSSLKPATVSVNGDDELLGSADDYLGDLLSSTDLGGAGFDGPSLNTIGGNGLDLSGGASVASPTIGSRSAASGPSSIVIWIGVAAASGVFALGVLIWWLVRSNGDAEWAVASQLYEQGSDIEAIEQLAVFVASYPNHAQAGSARVYQAAARLRQSVRGTANWPQAFESAKSILEPLAAQPDLPKIHPVLAKVLPMIAIELTVQAQAATGADDSALKIARANQALSMAEDDRFVPTTLRPWNPLQSANDALAILQRDADREQMLRSTAESVAKFLGLKQTVEAWIAHRQLAQQFPELQTKKAWRKLGEQISLAESTMVRAVAVEQPFEFREAASPTIASLALALRHGDASKAEGEARTLSKTIAKPLTNDHVDLPNTIVSWPLNGALYVVDGDSGRLLWRRYIGESDAGQHSDEPIRIVAGDSMDLLVVDHQRFELLRLAATDGTLRWRVPLGDSPVGAPVVVDQYCYVATASGKLWRIPLGFEGVQGADSAQRISLLQFPRGLTAGVGLTPATSTASSPDGNGIPAHAPALIVVADHGSMFVIDLKDWTCRQSIYLGHAPGTVQQPPIAVAEHWFVIENHGVKTSQLHVYVTDTKSNSLLPVQTVTLAGPIVEPGLQFDRSLLFNSIDGRTTLIAKSSRVGPTTFESRELNLNDVTDNRAAKRTWGDDVGRPRAIGLTRHGEQLWTVGDGLRKFDLHDLLASGSQPTVTNSKLISSTFGGTHHVFDGRRMMAKPVFIGESIFVAEALPQNHGIRLGRIDRNAGTTRVWETDVALTPAGIRIGDDRSAKLHLAAGHVATILFDPTPNASAHRVATVTAPPSTAARSIDGDESREVQSEVYCLDHEQFTVTASRLAEHLTIVAKTADARRQLIPLFDNVSSRPLFLGEQLLVPCVSGQLMLLNLTTLEPATAAYQLPYRTNDQPHTLSVASDGTQVFLSDAGRLMRLRLESQTTPKLVAVAETETATTLQGPLVCSGEYLLSANTAGRLAVFKANDLKLVREVDLAGRVCWGPTVSGDAVLLATCDLIACVNADGSDRWRAKLTQGSLIGEPLRHENALLLASRQGFVLKLNSRSGQLLASVDLGQPLGTGIAIHGDSYSVSTSDSTLIKFGFIAGPAEVQP